MGAVHLWGWDADAKVWCKLVCNAAGKLIIDPSEIFEDPPTDGEAGKAATSNWSHDHAADVSAHHTKFTITEHDVVARHPLANLDTLVCSEVEADSKITTHKGDASAHHVKYTDAEARTAVGYNGTKDWSIAGIGFDAHNPASDNISKTDDATLVVNVDGVSLSAPVNLPHGAVVTSVIVYGNAGAAAEEWYLTRVTLSSGGWGLLANGYINSADSEISLSTINNTLYAYHLYTSSLDTGDTVYGARITYTI